MRIKFVYKILPALVNYTKNLPNKFSGLAKGPYVKIHPKHFHDKGLLQHELTHVRQWYRTFGLHAILYKLNDKYKLKAEVEAYKVQLKYCLAPKYNIYLYAHFIATRYCLDVSRDEAVRLLSSY